jgi:hypothetical protein
MHRANEAEFVGDPANMRKEFTDLSSRRSTLAKWLNRWKGWPLRVSRRHRGEARRASDRFGDVGTGVTRERGLRIKEIDV